MPKTKISREDFEIMVAEQAEGCRIAAKEHGNDWTIKSCADIMRKCLMQNHQIIEEE